MTLNKNEHIKTLIRNSTTPLVIKNGLTDWSPLSWSLSKWLDIFTSGDTLDWRCGENNCSKEPHWESKCQYDCFTPAQFISHCQDTATKKWMYFDYKNIIHWKDRLEQSNMTTPWNHVGFSEQGIDETTLWIGSRGAHTPCHMDTYGCNLVAQVIGRKQWILYPPSDPGIMETQARVPYEESSIYSTVNFQCGREILSSTHIQDSTPYIVTLNPGDILFVPHKWWHYVEHLSTSLSLNTWIPLHNILESCAYIDEWLVRHLFKKFTHDISQEEKSKLLNPNEMNSSNDGEELLLLEKLIEQFQQQKRHLISPSREEIVQNSAMSTEQPILDSNRLLEEASSEGRISNLLDIQVITPLSKEPFVEFCQNKCACLQTVEVHPMKSEKNNSDLNNSFSEESYLQCGKDSDKIVQNKETPSDGLNQGCKRIRDNANDRMCVSSTKHICMSSSYENTIIENKTSESNHLSSELGEQSLPSDKLLTTNQAGNININQAHLINAFTHPEVIALVRKNLLKQFQFDVVKE